MDRVQELGADEAVDYTKDRFDDILKGRPVDAVIDMIGGEQPSQRLLIMLQLICCCPSHMPAHIMFRRCGVTQLQGPQEQGALPAHPEREGVRAQHTYQVTLLLARLHASAVAEPRRYVPADIFTFLGIHIGIDNLLSTSDVYRVALEHIMGMWCTRCIPLCESRTRKYSGCAGESWGSLAWVRHTG